MNKPKLIIYERFNGKQSLEDVFLSAFQSECDQLLQDNSSVIMDSIGHLRNHLVSERNKNGTDDRMTYR